MKVYSPEIDLQAWKLSRVYGIDMHDLCSRTGETIWQNWERDLANRVDPERHQYALKVLANHARNLKRKRDREQSDASPPSVIEQILLRPEEWGDHPAEQAIFKEGALRIYAAISTLRGRERDVMALIAIEMEHSSIMEELKMSRTNLTSTLSRARTTLRAALSLEAHGPRGGGDDGS